MKMTGRLLFWLRMGKWYDSAIMYYYVEGIELSHEVDVEKL